MPYALDISQGNNRHSFAPPSGMRSQGQKSGNSKRARVGARRQLWHLEKKPGNRCSPMASSIVTSEKQGKPAVSQTPISYGLRRALGQQWSLQHCTSIRQLSVKPQQYGSHNGKVWKKKVRRPQNWPHSYRDREMTIFNCKEIATLSGQNEVHYFSLAPKWE